jgi:hypothetical protein
MPDIQTVPVTQGDTPTRTFRITSSGAALNLTGVTVTAVIKPTIGTSDDDNAAHPLTVGAGLTIVDAAAGTVRMDIPSAVTTSPGWWFYKIQVTSSGHPETAVEGLMPVSPA